MPALSSQVAFQARDYRAALDYARQAIVLDPEFWIGHMMRGQALEQLGEYESALEALTTAARFSGENSKALAMRAYILAKTRAARRRARDAADARNRLQDQYVPPYAMALISAGLGEREAVFAVAGACLRRAGHAPDLSAGGPEMGFLSRGSSLRSAHRAVWLQANREPGPIAVGSNFLNVVYSSEPVRNPVPTGAGQVHHLQVVDFKRLKSPTHSIDRTAGC